MIGALRQRVTIQAENQTPDAGGGGALAWTTVASDIPASVIPASGREVFQAQMLQGIVTHKITMRRRTDVTTAHRIAWGARTFNVRAVINAAERNRFTELLVEEGVAT